MKVGPLVIRDVAQRLLEIEAHWLITADGNGTAAGWWRHDPAAAADNVPLEYL